MFHQEVRGGDQITLVIEDSDYSYQPIQLGQANKVDVLFEDEHLLVLNKPAGVKTHPNQPLEADTLLNDRICLPCAETAADLMWSIV